MPQVTRTSLATAVAAGWLSCSANAALAQGAPDGAERLTGKAAMGEWRDDKPGVWRMIRPEDVPPPYATPSPGNRASVAERPEGASPKAPPGYKVELWVSGLQKPRTSVAPKG